MKPVDVDDRIALVGATSSTPICWAGDGWTSIDRFGLTLPTQGLHYGTGVFEGIRSYWNASRGCSYLVRLDEHVQRLFDSCRLLRIDVGLDASEVRSLVIDLVVRNAFAGDLYIRPLAFKSRLLPDTPFGVGLDGVSDLLAVYAVPMAGRRRLAEVRCAVSSWRRVPGDCIPARAKVTGSYVNVALAVDEARAGGDDDAILLNTAGTVAEASTANVFVVSHGELATPSVDCDILAGQTRACVLEIAKGLGVRAYERPVPVAEIYTADEVFLTGTGCEITAVSHVNGRMVGAGHAGAVTSAVFATYSAAVRRSEHRNRYEHWTTPVPHVSSAVHKS